MRKQTPAVEAGDQFAAGLDLDRRPGEIAADRLKAAAEVLGQERLGDGVIGRIWRDLFSLQRPRPFSIGDMHLLLFESPAHFLGQFVEKLADGAVIKVAGILREDLSGKDCYRFSMARGFSS